MLSLQVRRCQKWVRFNNDLSRFGVRPGKTSPLNYYYGASVTREAVEGGGSLKVCQAWRLRR